MTSKDTILYSILALIIVALAFLFYSNYQLTTLLRGGPSAFSSSPLGTTTPSLTPLTTPPQTTEGNDLSDFVVGMSFWGEEGTVESISNNSISLRKEGGSAVTFTVTSKTTAIAVGARKSDQQINEELAVYNAKVAELMKDPEKNKAQLAALILPPASVETPINISAIKAGDNVAVLYSDKDKAATKTAVKIMRY